MSCREKMTVLRMPAAAAGIRDDKSWKEWCEGCSWGINMFSPALIGDGCGFYIDYILEDIEPYAGEWEDNYSRKLKPEEITHFLPVFRKEFPGFTCDDMEQVHYCEFAWYNGVEAPFIY